MPMITDFLKTARTKEDLKIALEVLREFKSGETHREWINCPIIAWVKLEQLEEFLVYLVEGKPLENDTIEYLMTHGVGFIDSNTDEPLETG